MKNICQGLLSWYQAYRWWVCEYNQVTLLIKKFFFTEIPVESSVQLYILNIDTINDSLMVRIYQYSFVYCIYINILLSYGFELYKL